MNKILFITVFIIGTFIVNSQAQTLEELKTQRAEIEAQVASLQSDAAALTGKINAFPGWRRGAQGILGLNFSGNDNWYAIKSPFSTSYSYGLSASGFANLMRDKYFWNNTLGINSQKSVTKPFENADEVEALTDALDLSSLFGYKLNPKWAVSAEAKYTSTIEEINDPGKLVSSIGVTWLPIDNLVVIIHPLGYEKNWPGELVSAAGAKIGATYASTIILGVSWTSNLSAFFPYSGGDATLKDQLDQDVVVVYDASDIMNWTWINGFSTNIWKGLGVGLNIGLRQDLQLADKFEVKSSGEVSDNPIQMYYNLGFSYTL